MNKNSACALFVGLVTLFSCSDEKLFNTNTPDAKGKMTMNAKVINSDGASTRASFDDVTASTWVFNFQTNDVVKVNNTENSTYCTFTKTEETFVSSDAMPTTATSTWYAYFPSENINLSNQAGTPESIANLYALAGSQADVLGGTQSLSIELAAKSSILKIDNQLGEINIQVKDADGKFISGLKANNGEYTVISGTTSTTLLSATEVGTYYVIVPSAQKIDIYNGDVKIKGTKEAGLTAGKCYSISIVPEYVDLGLPSGTLWATCNVGASSPEQYGNYYAWGETSPKDEYSWATYKYCSGTNRTLNKYCSNNSMGVYDGKNELETIDDAASVNKGKMWETPTYEQVTELTDTKYTKSEWTTYNGVKGRLVTSLINGKSIFLPAAGYNSYKSPSSVGGESLYWTKSVDKYSYWSYDCARVMTVSTYNFNTIGNWERYKGLVIRPVRKTHEYVDLGLSVKWATCNVGANSPEEYGDYFAWGATEPQEVYDWGHTPYQTQNTTDWRSTKFSKYLGATTSSYKTPTATDADALKTILDPEDDAAHVNWGGNWRMPTKKEQDELCTKCTWKWGSQNGIKGYTVVGPNGNSLFLPAAGSRYDSSILYGVGSLGYYWSSSLSSRYPYDAYELYFGSSDVNSRTDSRYCGHTIRPVCQ